MSAGTRPRDAAIAGALGLLALVVYLPAVRLEFAADDFLILDHLQKLDGFRHAAAYFEVNFYAYYRPLVFLSYALDWTTWGLDAAGFHLTNVLLHAVNTMLVYALARRVGDATVAGVAALVFTLHPVNQEAVFWVSGRFDLLATAWILGSLVLLWSPRPSAYWIGAACFGLALLSKESAATVVILAAAHGVLIEGRDQRWALARLVPIFVISAGYVVARSAAGVAPVGGSQRIGKVVMLMAGVGAVLWLARASARASAAQASAKASAARQPVARGIVAASVVAVVLGGLISVPQTRDLLGPSIGFVAYALYYLGPAGLWPASPEFLDPNQLSWVMGGVIGVALAAGLVAAGWPWLRARPAFLLAALIVGAALVPVSAMPSHAHLYLASVGAALFVALALALVPKPALRTAVVFAVLVAAGANLAAATARWLRTSDMTRGAVALVTAHPVPCADREVVLLTAPSGIDGIPCNLNYETFRFLGECVPRALHTLLRVMREDAEIDVTRPERDVIELRVRDYRGNIMASED
ncbi:MAG TPA: hypothetical protein VFO31_05085, partial [Vicinamibacterales bacterium]|nr:hypothetical protein [Vicinamibacterales bacterium]